jgi:hypothetical protein
MRYLVALEPGDARHAWGVTVPDLPGCFSAGDTMERHQLVTPCHAHEIDLRSGA